MKRFIPFILIITAITFLLGCPGIGRVDKEAADKVISMMKEKYGEDIVDMKIYRDKLQIAFPKDMHPRKKSDIFMEAAAEWWKAYPEGKKPKYRLYCWAYDDVISDDDIGGLNLINGPGGSVRIMGEPGIYSLRDVK